MPVFHHVFIRLLPIFFRPRRHASVQPDTQNLHLWTPPLPMDFDFCAYCKIPTELIFKNLTPGKWCEASINFARILHIISQEVPADALPGWSNPAIEYEQHIRFSLRSCPAAEEQKLREKRSLRALSYACACPQTPTFDNDKLLDSEAPVTVTVPLPVPVPVPVSVPDCSRHQQKRKRTYISLEYTLDPKLEDRKPKIQPLRIHGVRYTALGILLAATILCKIHLQFPTTQLSQLASSLNQTKEYIQEATVETSRSYSKLRNQRRRLLDLVIWRVGRTASCIKCRILRSKTKAFSWKGFRSLFKDIGERRTRFRSLSKEIGECIRCVKDIHTDVELILEAERQRRLAGDPTETPSTLAIM
ncbi:hypothetical protein B0H14DRAFT_2581396 [Mycena olivaceomarginata]|nr:hypothetical protein B0H14DRAFT_2581396 [Mycena olivaceomarginata]